MAAAVFLVKGGASPKPKANKVVSGGRNQPLDLGRLAGGRGRDGEEGVFVQRSEQEQVILDKLIPIDEATVQAHIIEERSEAIEQIHKGLVEINDMFTDLSKLIKEQESEVTVICHNAGTVGKTTRLVLYVMAESICLSGLFDALSQLSVIYLL